MSNKTTLNLLLLVVIAIAATLAFTGCSGGDDATPARPVSIVPSTDGVPLAHSEGTWYYRGPLAEYTFKVWDQSGVDWTRQYSLTISRLLPDGSTGVYLPLDPVVGHSLSPAGIFQIVATPRQPGWPLPTIQIHVGDFPSPAGATVIKS